MSQIFTANFFRGLVKEGGRQAFLTIEDHINNIAWDKLNNSFARSLGRAHDATWERMTDWYYSNQSEYYDQPAPRYVSDELDAQMTANDDRHRQRQTQVPDDIDIEHYRQFKTYSEKVEPLLIRLRIALNNLYTIFSEGRVSQIDYENLADTYNEVFAQFYKILSEYGENREAISEFCQDLLRNDTLQLEKEGAHRETLPFKPTRS